MSQKSMMNLFWQTLPAITLIGMFEGLPLKELIMGMFWQTLPAAIPVAMSVLWLLEKSVKQTFWQMLPAAIPIGVFEKRQFKRSLTGMF
jgi:hypothetical protein